jgi:hypothetical protein
VYEPQAAAALFLNALSLCLPAALLACGGESVEWEECRSTCDYRAELIFTLGDDDLGFMGPGPAVARIGDFYYVAHQDSRTSIQVFDRRSGFVRTIGREGQGPGEFRDILDLDVDSAGNLWALDAGNRRVSVMRVSGPRAEFLTTFRLPSGLRPNLAGMTLLAGGNALLNATEYVDNKPGPSTHLVNENQGIRWSLEEETLPPPEGRDNRRVYALDGRGGFWTARVRGPYRLEHRRLSDGGLIESVEPVRPWHDQHREAVRLPPREGDPLPPPGEPGGRVLQAAQLTDLLLRGDQLWVLGSYESLSRGTLDVFSTSGGHLLYSRALPFNPGGYVVGFDDDGLIVEFEGGDRPARLHFWRMTLD